MSQSRIVEVLDSIEKSCDPTPQVVGFVGGPIDGSYLSIRLRACLAVKCGNDVAIYDLQIGEDGKPLHAYRFHSLAAEVSLP